MLSVKEYFEKIKDYSLEQLDNEKRRIKDLMDRYNANELSDKEMNDVKSFEKPVEYYIRLKEYLNEQIKARKGERQYNELVLQNIRKLIETFDPTVMSHYRNGFLQTLESYSNYLDLPQYDKWQLWIEMAKKEIAEDEIINPPNFYNIEREKWYSGIGKYKKEPHNSKNLNDFINDLDKFMENMEKKDPNEPPIIVETQEEKAIREQIKEKREFRDKLCWVCKYFTEMPYIDIPYDVENKKYDYPMQLLQLKDWVLNNTNYNKDYNVSIDELMLDISNQKRDLYNFSTNELLALLVYFFKKEENQKGTIATYLKANVFDRICYILWERTYD